MASGQPSGAYHAPMVPASSPALPAAPDGLYAALSARDGRFDGRFFVGVTSTGVYCRPVCPVRTPQARNCRFFAHAAAAEAAGFRPCLRCRPERAPGLSRIDAPQTLADHALRMIDTAVNQGQHLSMPVLAAKLGVTDRHLRRIIAGRVGVSPHRYLNTQRLLLAKQLLTDTRLPVTEVAAACGFGSLRRFHAAFATQYRLQPEALRSSRLPAGGPDRGVGAVEVDLPYRLPMDLLGLQAFFARRAVDGLEWSGDGHWSRSLALQHAGRRLAGWFSLEASKHRPALRLRLAPSLAPALGAVVQRVRQAWDLDAEPERIDPVMARLPLPSVPGLRLPGGVEGFETGVRVILGQQVSLAAARTLTARLVQAFGEPVVTPWPSVNRLFPTAAALAAASADEIGRLGIVRQRVGALKALATAVESGMLDLSPTAPLQATLDLLRGLPGVGEWTVQLIAMRALAWPDAFPASDLGVMQAAGTRDPKTVAAAAADWSPWRAYAVIRLWRSLECEHERPL